MWETIKEILISTNAWFILAFILIVVIFIIFCIKKGLIKVNTKHIQIGGELTQRELIRREVETAHVFILSIEGKIISDIQDKEQYNEFFTKYILERVYDKVIEWIMFNHITTNQLYVQDKQESICNLVYTMNVADEYKTPEFKDRMCNWVKELIEQLVQVKEVYS